MIRVNSSSISSAVVMIRVLAEKARCVTIIRVNSSAKSTVDCSKAEGAICPAPPRPGSSATAGQDLLSPCRRYRFAPAGRSGY